MFDPDNPEWSYLERKAMIDSIIIKTCLKYCREVPSIPVESHDQLMAFYDSVVEEGQEGIMLRQKHSKYENKRSKNLLKLKPEDSSEGKILAMHEGDGNWSGVCKTFTIEWEGKIFDATFKGSKEEAAQCWKEQDFWIGKIVTFLYNGLTGLGVPNFARIDYNNCIKN